MAIFCWKSRRASLCIFIKMCLIHLIKKMVIATILKCYCWCCLWTYGACTLLSLNKFLSIYRSSKKKNTRYIISFCYAHQKAQHHLNHVIYTFWSVILSDPFLGNYPLSLTRKKKISQSSDLLSQFISKYFIA